MLGILAVRWPSGRGRRFANAAGNHRAGLKSTISNPFFIGNFVGVRCRRMVVGPRLGTLPGTVASMPICALPFAAASLLTRQSPKEPGFRQGPFALHRG